jgi:flagellar hook capping protein FlgD
MNPRDLIRRAAPTAHATPTFPIPVRFIALAVLGAVAVALAPSAGASPATVTSVSVSPAAPATCDSVTLRAEGILTSTCQQLKGAQIFGPVPIPEWVGPMPAYVTRIVLTVEQSDSGCATVITPYTRDFPIGRLPFGQHIVTALERVVDSTGALLDTSAVSTAFTVVSDTCATPSCTLLGFAPPPSPAMRLPCGDASAPAGGQGCFDVTLGNQVPVGGVQVRIQITDAQGQPLPAGWFTPQSVTTTPRSSAMQVESQTDGSAIQAMLFSGTGAAIAPGPGPILHVCYGVGGDVAAGVYRIAFEKSIVADPDGHELPPCPTFREIVGRFCVGATQGCDVDGNGIADIRDIIRIVRCALAGDACPDTIASRADCDGDGSIDIRDVICCVRKLLLVPGTRIRVPAPATGWIPARLGFAGDAGWTTSLQGRAVIVLDPGTGFGGTEFEVMSPPGVRITSLALDGSAGYRLEWTRDVDGRARALLLRAAPSDLGSARVVVGFERIGTGLETGALQIDNANAASWDAAAVPVDVSVGSVSISASPIAAPSVYAARPNPFTGTTEIPFALPSTGRVSLRVYDVAGRLMRTLVDGSRPAGVGRATWDGKDSAGRDLSGGVYFVKLSAAGVERTLRIMKLR